jgi:hypothetical protein
MPGRSHETRVLHVRGIGYVSRIDTYRKDGRTVRERLTGARRLGTRDFTVTRNRMR